jgi:hypothetical protein
MSLQMQQHLTLKAAMALRHQLKETYLHLNPFFKGVG